MTPWQLVLSPHPVAAVTRADRHRLVSTSGCGACGRLSPARLRRVPARRGTCVSTVRPPSQPSTSRRETRSATASTASTGFSLLLGSSPSGWVPRLPAPRTSIPLPRVRLPWMRLPLSSGTGALVGPRRRRGVNSTLSWEVAAIRMTATDPGGGERLHRCQISEGAASWVRVLLVASGWMPRVDGLWRSLVAHLTGGQGVVGSNPASPTRS